MPRCQCLNLLYLCVAVIVKASSGPRYVVGCRSKIDKASLKPGTRVSLETITLTIMRKLPREVDPTVFNMLQVSRIPRTARSLMQSLHGI